MKERVTQYEQSLNDYARVLENLKSALDAFEEAQPAYRALCAYYGSEAYHEDLAAERRGEYDDVPRGVLSEDGVYNLMADHFDLSIRLLELGTKAVSAR